MYFTVRDVAHRLQVHVETVRRWLRTGALQGIPLGHAGYRIEAHALEDFLQRQQQHKHYLSAQHVQQLGTPSTLNEYSRDVLEALFQLSQSLEQKTDEKAPATILYPHELPAEKKLIQIIGNLTAVAVEREQLITQRTLAQTAELASQQANDHMELFMGLVTHELKTPITSMQGNLQLLQRRLRRLATGIPIEPDTLAQMQKLVERAEQQVRRQTRLINDLMDASQIQAGKLEIYPKGCNLAQIVRETVTECQHTYPERQIMYGTFSTHPVPVSADVERIRQVINNYLSNALKYAPPAQPITVSLTVSEQTAHVAVQDRGPGLDLHVQRQVWERFEQLPHTTIHTDSGKGLGLGLYISQMIIQQHHGRVGVESVPAEGATFWFSLPLLPKEDLTML